jgi:hypothetical protein
VAGQDGKSMQNSKCKVQNVFAAQFNFAFLILHFELFSHEFSASGKP